MAEPAPALAIVGGGNMAQALVRGGLDAGVLQSERVMVLEPEGGKRDVLRGWRVGVTGSAPELVDWLRGMGAAGDGAAQLLLAVKPQSLAEVGREVGPRLTGRQVVISILAGTPTARVQSAMQAGGDAAIIVVRAMSNTPAQVRRATTGIARGEGATEEDADLALRLFGALGRIVQIPEEMMDAFTAVAGSGPAYVFYLAEAMTKAATRVGFDPDAAAWIVRWTLAGSAALLDATDQPAATLRAAVTSKGGTTAAATAVLDEAGVMEALVRAVEAARDRGREMGGSG